MAWTNVFDLLPGCSTASRWLASAVSSAFPVRPATRSTIGHQDCGLDGLTDRSRRPYRHANQLPMQVEKLVIALKKEYPRWGVPKIREQGR